MKVVLRFTTYRRATITVVAAFLAAMGALLVWGTQTAYTQTIPSTLPTYTIQDLGFLPGGTESEADRINNSSQVAGNSDTSDNTSAFLYTNGSMINLGGLPGSPNPASEAYDLNNNLDNNNMPQVVGDAIADSTNDRHPFLYQGGTMTDLGLLSGAQGIPFASGRASGINDAGLIVGDSDTTTPQGERATHAFLYQGGTMTDLGTLGGRSSEATDINAGGQIVGRADDSNGYPQPFLYENGTMTNLGVLPGYVTGEANAINDSKQVLGSSFRGLGKGDDQHGFIYDVNTKTMTDIGNPGQGRACALWPRDINSSGQVVGFVDVNGPEGCSNPGAYLYKDGVWTNLITLLPNNSGWSYLKASGINDKGQIVGLGVMNNDPNYHAHAYIMTPATSQDLVNSLKSSLKSLNLASGTNTSLQAKLTDALNAVKGNDTSSACAALQDFINEVNAQSGKKITQSDATNLLNEAKQIMTALGCK